MYRLVIVSSVLLLGAACGEESDPFATGDPADGGSSVMPEDPDARVPRADAAPQADAAPTSCAPLPGRLIVLGDSINACSTVGGKNNARCGTKIFADYLASEHAPGAEYQNFAQPAAVTRSVAANQLDDIETGIPGHALVQIFVGGNDLQPYIFISDDDALAKFDTDMPAILAEWDKIFGFFDDAARFPDGVTILMNTQYNPFDDCTAPPYNLSAVKTELLQQYNEELEKLAAARANTSIVDQHAIYLGHGHHHEVETCPHYMPGAAGWMGDLIHPNPEGYANLAAQWNARADQLYGAGCQ